MSFFNNLINGLKKIIANVLPASPFQPYLQSINDAIKPFMGYVNWFIPVGWILAVVSVWLGAIALFYLYQIILRWLGAID